MRNGRYELKPATCSVARYARDGSVDQCSLCGVNHVDGSPMSGRPMKLHSSCQNVNWYPTARSTATDRTAAAANIAPERRVAISAARSIAS